MHVYKSLFMAVLFVALTPGILLTLPPKSSKLVVAVTHGVVFAVVYYLTHKMVPTGLYEGFAVSCASTAACPAAAVKGGATCYSLSGTSPGVCCLPGGVKVNSAAPAACCSGAFVTDNTGKVIVNAAGQGTCAAVPAGMGKQL